MLIQLEARLNLDTESVATPTSDMEESGLEFPIIDSQEREGQESWMGGASGTGDLGELLQDLEHSSSSSSDSEMED